MKQLFTSIRLFLFTIFLGSTFTYGYSQTSGPLDYRLYTTKAHPYMIPELPSGSEFYLSIKTGPPIYISITGLDKGSGSYYIGGSISQRTDGDTILIQAGWVGNWIVNYKKNGVEMVIGLHTNYQADLQDQTIGSTTFGDYPDFIWVAQGGSAKVSAGPWMNPTGGSQGYYVWRSLDESIINAGYADSLHTFMAGNYISQTVDISSTATRDTISILEKPILNMTAKSMNFPTTTAGVKYKLLKVGSINVTDTTWVESQVFVGDGNSKNITLADGKYKLTTTFGIHAAVYPYGYFVVGVTTALDKTKEENMNYRLVDNRLQFDNEVNFKFYSLQGQLLQQEQGRSFKLCRQAGILKATDKNGNVLTTKIILK